MPVEILMPSAGPSMTEGSVVRWLKREGDAVKRGEALVEIETDKAVIEVEAESDGVLGKILVAEGTNNVKVDSIVGLIAVNGENPASLAAATSVSAASVKQEAQSATAAVPAAPVKAAPVGHVGRILASPLARRIAKELGVDLSKVSGSGPKGRVLRADVEAAVQAAAVLQAATHAPEPQKSAPPTVASVNYEDIPHTNMRRTIAQRLGEAKRSVPHFYLSVDCCVDALLDIRRQMNRQVDGVKLSVNDFIVKAVALALRRIPACNASWTDDAIRRYRDVDISVAVATPNGLITPIVRNADQKSLGRISGDVKDLAARAREGKLKPEEYQGGGFTISNLGMFGIREFAAIINPPQACILAVGASEQRPVVRDGALAVATLMTCTLSADHRVVDGAMGAEFLAEFRKLIENPLTILV